MQRSIWRIDRVSIGLGVVLGPLLVFLVLWGPKADTNSIQIKVGLVALVLFGALSMWRMRVVLDDDGVEVRGLLHTRTAGWSEVIEASPRWWHTKITLRDRPALRSGAVGKSVVRLWFGTEGRADRFAHEVNERVRRYERSHGTTSAV